MIQPLVRYVIIPAAVATFLLPSASCGAQGLGSGGPSQTAPTPRTTDGKPDLAGLWIAGGGGGARVDEAGNITIGAGRGREGTLTNFERDSGIQQRSDPNRPFFKPDYWPLVEYYDENGYTEDPEFLCFPAGVPQIVNGGDKLIFLYNQHNTFRTIYMDGRPHPPEDEWVGRWYGHSVGRWEGDTLVIDSVDFTDESWLGWPGWVHSTNMRVEERMTREGDALRWEATVIDPDALLKPFVLARVVRRLNRDPKAELAEDLPCSERDSRHIVTKERG